MRVQTGSPERPPGSRRTSDAEPRGGGGGPPAPRVSTASSRSAGGNADAAARPRSVSMGAVPAAAAVGVRDAAAFDAWRATVQRRGFSPLRVQYASAHQVRSLSSILLKPKSDMSMDRFPAVRTFLSSD